MKKQLWIQLDPINHKCFSRSEAREILADTEGFEKVTFDFDGIGMIGQGFADEIFRVFHHKYPDIRLETDHMNESVIFMVERAKIESEG